MKLKSKLTSGIVIACFLLGGMTLHAQGIYNKPSSSDNNGNNTVSTQQSGYSKGGLFRDGGDDDTPGSGGDDGQADPDGTSHEDPIGEGFLILSLLSGAYALLVKKKNIRNRNKNEE